MSKNIHYRDYVTDYLIPVINHIKNGTNHTEAFREVANKLGVTYQTVNDRCSRGLSIKTARFVEMVKTGEIKKHLLTQFPDRLELLKSKI